MDIQLVYEPYAKEYVIIEFQGDLENEEEGSLNYLEIGNLEKIDEKKYMMRIGIYDLVGNVTELKDPILINEKVNKDDQLIIYVRGVCNKRIFFSQRPTPILERAMKKIKRVSEQPITNDAKANVYSIFNKQNKKV